MLKASSSKSVWFFQLELYFLLTNRITSTFALAVRSALRKSKEPKTEETEAPAKSDKEIAAEKFKKSREEVKAAKAKAEQRKKVFIPNTLKTNTAKNFYLKAYKGKYITANIYNMLTSIGDAKSYDQTFVNAVNNGELNSTKAVTDFLLKNDVNDNTFDLIKIADYVITDYSAIAFEAAVVNRPIFFYVYDLNEYKENRGLNVNLNKEMKHATFNNITDIISIIEKKEYPYEEYEKFKSKYIETLDTENSKRIVENIKRRVKGV